MRSIVVVVVIVLSVVVATGRASLLCVLHALLLARGSLGLFAPLTHRVGDIVALGSLRLLPHRRNALLRLASDLNRGPISLPVDPLLLDKIQKVVVAIKLTGQHRLRLLQQLEGAAHLSLSNAWRFSSPDGGSLSS